MYWKNLKNIEKVMKDDELFYERFMKAKKNKENRIFEVHIHIHRRISSRGTKERE